MTEEARVVSDLEKRLDLQHHMPRPRTLIVAVVIVLGGVLVAWPLASSSPRAGWTGGPISNHHRLIEKECDRCHPVAFGGAPDAPCVACHNMHDHAAAVSGVVQSHPELMSRCTSCHREHHGEQDLIPNNSSLCADCHRQIATLLPASTQPNIADFDDHPEFAVQAWSGDPPVLKRVRIGEKGFRDKSTVKFSHARHYELPPRPGVAPFACGSCHEAAPDRNDLKGVSFAQHCARCHDIEFDNRVDNSIVPHGDARWAFAFVRAEVARMQAETNSDATYAKIDEEARTQEAALFTEGGACLQCHDVEKVEPKGPAQARFRVAPPVRTRWMPAAVFEHGTHRATTCEECHAGIRASMSARDIVLPSITLCRQCHAVPGTPDKVSSPCLQCHAYHPQR